MSVLAPADWGQILQEPNLRKDLGSVAARRKMWGDRNTEMTTASSSAMDQLALALMAARDKQMADLAAADALRRGTGGGGGGGRRGSGGGSAPAALLPDAPVGQTNWFDQLAGLYGPSAAPPAFTPPSPYNPGTVAMSAFGPVSPPKPNFGIGVGRQGRGFKPIARPLPKPTRHNVRLS